MFTVYAFPTPNSIKVPIALEELGLPHNLLPVNVRQGDQKQPEFLRINPNGKVPVLMDDSPVDGEAVTLTESAAILIYLAEKTHRLLPSKGIARARVFEQLFFHASGLGPALGQAGFFKRNDEKLPIAIQRFDTEARRVLKVLDGILGKNEFVAGPDITIADIAHFGWLWRREFALIDFTETPNVARWYEAFSQRQSVSRAIDVLNGLVPAA